VTPLVKVAYINGSGLDIPPYGVIQLDGVSGGGGFASAIQPFQNTSSVYSGGPMMVDDGKGTTASGSGRYGSCYRLGEGFAPARYSQSYSYTAQPWDEIGPVAGSFDLQPMGTGFYFAANHGPGTIFTIECPVGRWYYAMTLGPLVTGSTTTPSQTTVDVYVPQFYGTVSNLVRTQNTKLQGLTVVNYDDSLSANSGAFCKIEWGFGHWSITRWIGCPP